MQMELEACRDEGKQIFRCNHCIINNYPEVYWPPMPLPISPGYAKRLDWNVEDGKEGYLVTYF